MKSVSTKLFSIALCIVLSAVLVPGVFAVESSDVITTESQLFNVGYAFTETNGNTYWMLWDSEDMSKSADVPGDDALVLERFRNAVDTCIIYEERFNQGIYTLIAGCISPVIWAVTIPDIFESWDQAEFAAKKADYYFSLIE